MTDPVRLRPNPYDDPVRVHVGDAADETPKVFHFAVDGQPACGLDAETQSIAPCNVFATDWPCADCLADLAPEREPGTMARRFSDQPGERMLVTCPACNRFLVPCGTGHHITGHTPSEFGLSPLGVTTDRDPGQPVATDGGERP